MHGGDIFLSHADDARPKSHLGVVAEAEAAIRARVEEEAGRSKQKASLREQDLRIMLMAAAKIGRLGQSWWALGLRTIDGVDRPQDTLAIFSLLFPYFIGYFIL